MTDPGDVAPTFAVGITRDAESTIVTFSGELDFSTAMSMREAFLDSEVANASAVHVDLTRASFLDSSALGVLVAGCRRMRSTGGAFSVTCDPGPVRLILEVSGLIEYLQVMPGS